MNAPFADLSSQAICAFHDERVAQLDRAPISAAAEASEAWQWIEADHRYNTLLWDEEDLARRTEVPDAAIAANKRAIDGYNQRRNDAIEKIDEALLARIASVTPRENAWHNSETAGAMIDRLSILALRLRHMTEQTERTDVAPAHIASCREKLARLVQQRADLARCLDTLLTRAGEGRAFWRIYRQFKMYNDPELNPHLHGGKR